MQTVFRESRFTEHETSSANINFHPAKNRRIETQLSHKLDRPLGGLHDSIALFIRRNIICNECLVFLRCDAPTILFTFYLQLLNPRGSYKVLELPGIRLHC